MMPLSVGTSCFIDSLLGNKVYLSVITDGLQPYRQIQPTEENLYIKKIVSRTKEVYAIHTPAWVGGWVGRWADGQMDKWLHAWVNEWVGR